MSARIFIDGAAGTTGLEIAERLTGRDEFELLILDDASRKSPQARKEALHAADFAILCLHDDAAREAVALAEGAKVRIIDASSAHRTSPGWVYGFPELSGRDQVANATRVSNPGCYPTGFLALITPLVRAGLLPADWPYTVNAVSGYSGGGRALIERFDAEPDLAFRAYGLALDHKHLPEMQHHAGLTHSPVFTPSVVPAHRGMVVDIPLPLSAMGITATAQALRDELIRFYEGSALISVADDIPGELLLTRNQPANDRMELRVCANPAGTQARLVAVLDNLGKGASGAAVQSLNLMAGLPEMAGLRL